MRTVGLIIWLFFLLLVAIYLAVSTVLAQEHQHPPQDQAIHEQFYKTWMIRPEQTSSCCSSQDCAPAEVREIEGRVQARSSISGDWVTVRKERIEQNYSDARESPDGRNHLCYNPNIYQALCFTYGSGT